MSEILLPWLLTLITAASTIFGSCIVFVVKVTPEQPLPPHLLAASLGCAAGVMTYISVAELFSKSEVSAGLTRTVLFTVSSILRVERGLEWPCCLPCVPSCVHDVGLECDRCMLLA